MSYQSHQQFYRNPRSYDEILSDLSPYEVEFYKDYLEKAQNVLYLGSGSGRLLKHFLKINPHITGVEISPPMIQAAKKLIPDAHIINADVLTLHIKKKFDLILAPYLFLFHFQKREFQKIFEVVNRHITQDGLFISHNFNPYLDPKISCELQCVDLFGDTFEKVYNSYDHQKRICREYIERTNLKTNEQSLVVLTWYYYYPEEFRVACRDANLCVKNIYGSYRKEPLNPKDSEDMIILCSRK